MMWCLLLTRWYTTKESVASWYGFYQVISILICVFIWTPGISLCFLRYFVAGAVLSRCRLRQKYLWPLPCWGSKPTSGVILIVSWLLARSRLRALGRKSRVMSQAYIRAADVHGTKTLCLDNELYCMNWGSKSDIIHLLKGAWLLLFLLWSFKKRLTTRY